MPDESNVPSLRCPICGTPVPDTGMRSAGGMFAPDAEPTFSPAAYRQHATCPSCGKALVRNPSPGSEAPHLAEWRLPRPLVQFGGTAIMRSTDMPAGGGSMIEGSAHLGAGGTLAASGTVVKRRYPIDRTMWEATCAGIGMGISTPFGYGAMFIGGAVGYVWSRWRWEEDD